MAHNERACWAGIRSPGARPRGQQQHFLPSTHPPTHPCTHFRLGARKAAALLRGVQRAGGFVESRNQVWRELGVLGNRVFTNAAPYLRVRASAKGEGGALGVARALLEGPGAGQRCGIPRRWQGWLRLVQAPWAANVGADVMQAFSVVTLRAAPTLSAFPPNSPGTANLEMDPLDDTRIHPESYEFAIQVSKQPSSSRAAAGQCCDGQAHAHGKGGGQQSLARLAASSLTRFLPNHSALPPDAHALGWCHTSGSRCSWLVPHSWLTLLCPLNSHADGPVGCAQRGGRGRPGGGCGERLCSPAGGCGRHARASHRAWPLLSGRVCCARGCLRGGVPLTCPPALLAPPSLCFPTCHRDRHLLPLNEVFFTY